MQPLRQFVERHCEQLLPLTQESLRQELVKIVRTQQQLIVFRLLLQHIDMIELDDGSLRQLIVRVGE